MKAVVLEAFNPEERLRVADDWPRPVRRKGEVLVRVVATAVNRSVHKTADGFIPSWMATLPKVGSGRVDLRDKQAALRGAAARAGGRRLPVRQHKTPHGRGAVESRRCACVYAAAALASPAAGAGR